MENEELIRVENISKSFEGNAVLKDVSFTIKKGEIVGLVGENGAGKSTLMNILFGMESIKDTGGYEGAIYLEGKKVSFTNPLQALKAGFGMVHQEFSLLPSFTITENMLLNNEKLKPNFLSKILGRLGSNLKTIDKDACMQKAQKAIDMLGVNLDVNALVEDMPVGHKQFIEIAREIGKEEAKLIIMDEPTAVLTEQEAEILMKAMKNLSKKGIAIIFISHRLREIINVADKMIVLRDGMIVQEKNPKEVTIKEIASWMVGRELKLEKEKNKERKDVENADVIMEVEHLYVDMPGEVVKDVSLSIKRGEILGIAGLSGQGKLGIPNGIMGLYGAGGNVTYNGKKIDVSNPRSALNLGIAFVSEDRRGVGLLLDEGIDWNIAFNAMQIQNKFLDRWGFINIRSDKKIRAVANEYIDKLAIKCTGAHQKARHLSGGNQQKVCLAKAFACEPSLLFVSEPTRGIDIGAKKIVLDALRDVNKEKGCTIVMISSELEELRSIADRIAVVHEGAIFGVLKADESVEKFGLMMSGESVGD